MYLTIDKKLLNIENSLLIQDVDLTSLTMACK